MRCFKRIVFTFCVTLLLIALTVGTISMFGKSQTVKADEISVEQWKMIEITLTSSENYTNPYLDVDVEATFTGPGISMTMPGFWDGGNTWKVRFAPTTVGSWTYSTKCTQTTNSGLHGQTGSITVSAYTGNLDIYKHGWALKASSNNRYLTYADGTPFYYFDFTRWGALTSERQNSNDYRFSSQFEALRVQCSADLAFCTGKFK
jgi:hypothetical protein